MTGLLDVARQAEQAQLSRDVGMSRHGLLNDDTPLQRAQYGGMYGSLMQDPADKARMERQMMEDTLAMMPMAGMTTYHGSPHIFNKFRMDKIGTGEGAQAYGHGLYLAENPNVAQGYKERLSRQGGLLAKAPRYTVEGKTDGYMDDVIHEIQTAHKGDIDKFIAKTKKDFVSTNDINELKGNPKRLEALYEIRDENIDFARSLKGKKIEEIGNLYKVDLPDEQIKKMLDWDKPLSEQPKSVMDAVDRVLPKSKRDDLARVGYARGRFNDTFDKSEAIPLGQWTGKDVEFSLGRETRNAFGGKYQDYYKKAQGSYQGVASLLLKEQGIPGIKYLDQGSRQAGKGTRNFVVFDENIPQILERNQQPIGGLLGK